MKAATMLIILLSHHGYWLGGQSESITANWAVEQNMPPAILHWELRIGSTPLAHGDASMGASGLAAPIAIAVPHVRARTEMQWIYLLKSAGNGKELESGQKQTWVYPPLPWKEVASDLGTQRLYVIDQPQELGTFFSSVGVKATVLPDCESLQTVRPAIVIVAKGQFGRSPFAQAPLISLARSGAQVLVLEQPQFATPGGYTLRRRTDVARVCWREDHPLLANLNSDDLKSWLDGLDEVIAIRLPKDEPALEIGYWPREIPGKQPVPIDAILAVKAIGAGRIIFSQIPLENWSDDPRSQTFLFNALNYMQTRPEPTPPPSQRPTSQPVASIQVPTITIPSGDTP